MEEMECGMGSSHLKIFCSKMDQLWVTYIFRICTQALDECMCIMGSFWSAELQKCCLAQQTWAEEISRYIQR